MSSAYIINWKTLLAFGKSFIYIINKRSPRIDPCGTPYGVSITSEVSVLTLIIKCYGLMCQKLQINLGRHLKVCSFGPFENLNSPSSGAMRIQLNDFL